MESVVNRTKALVNRLWSGSPLLTGTGLLMLVVLAASLVGLVVDSRIVTGVPVWLKPVKFAISTAVYMLTLAGIFTLLPEWRRTRRVVECVTAFVMVLEVGIIDMQAWRGTTSHFNVSTPFDAAMFLIMGSAIVVQTITSIAVAVALWRQRFADRALGWALRFAMMITIIGASTGSLMTRPTAAQLEEVRATGRMPISGAHTVGAPDGGPGLPATGWSLEHGDIRIPHFLGLHAMQLLPLFALALRRRRLTESARVRLVVVAAASQLSLFAILLWQALRGQSLIEPDGVTRIALTAWMVTMMVAAWRARSDGPAEAGRYVGSAVRRTNA
jgi:hypothetical protein